MKTIHLDKKAALLSSDAKLAQTPLPCGQCMNCRINKAREIKHRLLLEQMVWPYSCFLTLTYDDEHLPEDYGLRKEDFQKFIKRLRYRLGKEKIRYYGIGEYGDKRGRPHYHAALYGISTFHNPILEKAWSMDGKLLGRVHAGTLTKHSAGYIADYTVKRFTRKGHPLLFGRNPEFSVSSKQGGGIGYPAIKNISEKLRSNDYWEPKFINEIMTGGKRMPLGRYLSNKLLEENTKHLSREERIRVYDEKQQQFEKICQELEESFDGSCSYAEHIRKFDEGAKNAREKRHKIFKAKRKL